MKWLLSEDQIVDVRAKHSIDGKVDSYYEIALNRAQAAHIFERLNERCTVHPIWLAISLKPVFASHRYDCEKCMIGFEAEVKP